MTLGVQKGFLTTKDTKKTRKFSRKADIPTGDFLSRNLLFVAFGLNYEKISEGFDHHTNLTLKKVRAFSCLSWLKKIFGRGLPIEKE